MRNDLYRAFQYYLFTDRLAEEYFISWCVDRALIAQQLLSHYAFILGEMERTFLFKATQLTTHSHDPHNATYFVRI